MDQAEDVDAPQRSNVVQLRGDLALAEARGFLSALRERPFVAAVVFDEDIVVYCKGIDPDDAARIMRSLADQMESED